jgi:hypothetical protein
MPTPGDAPTAEQLRIHPVVQAALERAWKDSLPDDPDNRHEEGGWIYIDTTTREISIRRAHSGYQSELNLDKPPVVSGSIVVGVFHTHPNPSSDGWDPGPSEADRRADERDGVPDLIRANNGVHFSGPQSRRGGLAGGPGFPA